MIDRNAQKKLTDLLGSEYFSTKPEDMVMYGSDGTNMPQLRADAVARPGSVEEAAAIIRIAIEHHIPIIPRGAGSCLTGGAAATMGGLVVVMARFDRILEIDPDNLLAVAEPGVVTSDFQAAAERQGLFYPPDPASREFSTLGGNAAENAGGTRAVKYGVTRDYILGLQAVLGTGEIVDTGVRTVKGVVGYDLTRLLVGSEGTLGIITRLILRLVPAPETRRTVIAYYENLNAVARTVAALTAARIVPATVEFMDRASIACVDDYLGLGLDRNVGALLLIETDGPAASAEDEARRATEICRERGALQVRMAESAKEADDLWRARRAISPALVRLATGKLNEDIVVPRSLIPDMIARVEEISRRRGIRIVCFGHAGDGNIHINAMYNKSDPNQSRQAHESAHEIFAAALDLGGTISGEHGVGTTKQDFIAMEIKPAALDLMRRVKAAFDPHGIMNPGKMFPRDA